jgi:hypothetical protein
MDNPSTLRSKAARYFANAASSKTVREAERLNEVGRQLEVWADDLEEIDDAREQKATKLGDERRRRTDDGRR